MSTRDAASKHIHFIALSGSGPITPDECVRFANSLTSLQYEARISDLTPLTCIKECALKNLHNGYVGNDRCCACFTCLFDEHSFLL